MFGIKMSSFTTDKYLSEHHFCHFGIRLIGIQPSSVVYQILSTKEVPSHECAHHGEQHAREIDLLTGKTAASEHRIRAEIEFYRQLIKEWFQLGVPFPLIAVGGILSTSKSHSHCRLGEHPKKEARLNSRTNTTAPTARSHQPDTTSTRRYTSADVPDGKRHPQQGPMEGIQGTRQASDEKTPNIRRSLG